MLHKACVVLASFKALDRDEAKTSTEQSMHGPFVLGALTVILQMAFEAAVFQNRFEIDEQSPHSRLQALTEQLLLAANDLPSNGIPEAEEIAGKAAIVSYISEISNRVRAAILTPCSSCFRLP